MEKTSTWQTFILLVKGNIGPGCLALPFCFSMLGPFYSLGFVVFIGFFCVYNMWVLVRCKRKFPGVKTYGELASATLGSYGESLVEFFLALMQLSICCVYFSFIGEYYYLPWEFTSIGDSLQPILGIDQATITILLAFPVLILTNLRHMSELAPLSLIASASLCVALFLILSAAFHRFLENLEPDIPSFRFNKIIPFFVSTIYAYEGIGIILPIEDAMERPQDFPLVLTFALSIVTVVYITLAEAVILTFGNVDDAGITGFLLREGSLSNQMASLISCLISVAVLLSYPLQLYPALQVIEAYCGYSKDNSETSFCCRSRGSVGLGSPQYTRHVNVDPFHSLSDISVDVMENSPLVLEMNHTHKAHLATHKSNENSSFQSFPRFPRSSVRIALVIFSSVVSTLVPNVGLLVSLAGASSGAALSLIFPPLLDLISSRNRNEDTSTAEIILLILSMCLGVIAALLGTGVAIIDIVKTFRP